MPWQARKKFTQESLYLHGIFNDITDQDTSFVDSKHKHMMKSGAPPDTFGVLYRMVSYRKSMVSQAEFLRVITLWFLVLSQFFKDGIGPFKRQKKRFFWFIYVPA